MGIKNCPLCGGEARERGHKGVGTAVVCTVCNANTGYQQRSRQESIEAWNKRDITGETSDGYHTFDELYHHRAVLFAVVCSFFEGIAWKSRLHHDGTMYNGMFIVGIETPEGQATYHYDIDPYWDMFDINELPYAPEWDDHTPQMAIDRIEKLIFRT